MSEIIKDNNSELVAKRWAKALIDLAREDESLSLDAVSDDLDKVVSTMQSSSELMEAFNNPSVSKIEKQIILSKIFQDKINSLVYNYLFNLNLRQRVNLLPQIKDEFLKELEILKNVVRVDVISAFELSDDKKNYVNERLAEKLDKNIITNWQIDENIIAGLVFNINDLVIDNSVRHKLEKLSKEIIKG